jgi:predicted nucleic acid-binding protein
VAVVVFDSDVLIAFLGREDAQHARAVERMRQALEPAARRLVCAVNYSEVLIGPLRAVGLAGAETVDAMFARLGIEMVAVDTDLARRAAAVRVQTGLRLPDAYAIATAVRARRSGAEDVRLETFDKKVANAFS